MKKKSYGMNSNNTTIMTTNYYSLSKYGTISNEMKKKYLQKITDMKKHTFIIHHDMCQEINELCRSRNKRKIKFC